MMRWFSLVLLVSAFAGCSRQDGEKREPEYVFAPIVAASAHIAVVEKPDASRALLIGEAAKALEPYLVRAGVRCFTSAEGKFDVVAVACSEMGGKSCDRLLRYLSENGIVVWLMDVAGVSAEDFRRKLSGFTLRQAHLWMPGETRWMLVGRKVPRKIKLSAMLDFYSRESVFDDFAFAHCSSLQEIFANYIGELEAVLPAFERGDLSAAVKPEFFLERKIPEIGWISVDGVDKDIAGDVFAKIREMQKIRREVVEGNIASAQARDLEGESRATDLWAKAAERNPDDMFLLERLDRLDRNAKGFMAVRKVLLAMKCYETMALIRPDDPVALHNFGMCLKKIGKLDLAEKILDRARKLSK